MTPIRVFLADDHPVVLAGIRALVEAAADLQVVGQATDGAAALEAAVALQPDVAVLDLSMPGLGGVALAERLGAASPRTRIVILTVHEDRAYVRRLLEVGVAGYVLKRAAPDELVRAIRTVAAGHTYLDPAVAALVLALAHAAPVPADAAALPAPSGREEAVLRLAATGYGNKAIALALGITVKTVEAHKARGMNKLGFGSRVELVSYATARGWLAPG